ncbi:hypothetical protein AB0C44_07955 [Micromonospora taraxaci]|uniref:hypothetical protein n=1 Tax=Micromonospora taraxaci TaxID=1316803 RepID=UPI0033FA178B
MTPPHLHATAAAWSLQAARGRLATLATDEAAQIAAEAMEAPSVLRSPVYGGPHASGSHSDPTPGMVGIAERPGRRNRWAEMRGRLDGKLDWIADTLRLPYALDDGITRILEAISAMQPGTAATVTRHLVDEEKWVRAAIREDRPTALLDVPCPACDARCRLRVQTVGPQDAWTVVCTGHWEDGEHHPCLCTGQGCPCGMPGAVEGVAHIWPRAAVIGAVGGTR